MDNQMGGRSGPERKRVEATREGRKKCMPNGSQNQLSFHNDCNRRGIGRGQQWEGKQRNPQCPQSSPHEQPTCQPNQRKEQLAHVSGRQQPNELPLSPPNHLPEKRRQDTFGEQRRRGPLHHTSGANTDRAPSIGNGRAESKRKGTPSSFAITVSKGVRSVNEFPFNSVERVVERQRPLEATERIGAAASCDQALYPLQEPQVNMESRCKAQLRLEKIKNNRKSASDGRFKPYKISRTSVPTDGTRPPAVYDVPKKKPFPAMCTKVEGEALAVLNSLKKSLRHFNSEKPRNRVQEESRGDGETDVSEGEKQPSRKIIPEQQCREVADSELVTEASMRQPIRHGVTKQPSTGVSKSLARNLFKRKSNGDTSYENVKKVCENVEVESPRANLGSSHDVLRSAENLLQSANICKVPSQAVENPPALAVPEALQQEVEAMDWEPLSEEHLLTELKTVRNNLEDYHSVVSTSFSKCMTHVDDVREVESTEECPLYVVVDTNVLISNLNLIDKLLTEKVGDFKPIIAIPWQVLKELDFLKDGKSCTNDKKDGSQAASVVKSARKASSFLLEKSESIYCQSQKDARLDHENFVIEVPDDNIIRCCLHIKLKGHNMVLLSNDRNLCLKCSAVDVLAVSEETIISYMNKKNKPSGTMSDVEKLPSKDICKDYDLCVIACQLGTAVKDFLSSVVEQGLSQKYKKMWKWYAALKPPWTLVDVVTCAHLQWAALTSLESVKKPVSKLKNLQNFFINVKYEKPLAESEVEKALRECSELTATLPLAFEHLVRPMNDKLETLKIALIEKKNGMKRAQVQRVVECFQLVELVSKYYCQLYPNSCTGGTIVVDGTDNFKELLAGINIPPLVDLISMLESMLMVLEKLHELFCSSQGLVSSESTEALARPTRDCLVQFCSKMNVDFSTMSQEDVMAFFVHPTIRESMGSALYQFSAYMEHLKNRVPW